MRDRPRDDEPPDQPPEGDPPERRPDGPGRPNEPSKEYQPDRRKLTPIQREYVRQTAAEGLPEFPGGVPYTIDWKTGERTDKRLPGSSSGDAPDDSADEPDDTADHAPDAVADGDAPDETPGVESPLADTRPYDQVGGLVRPDHRDQWSLEHVVPRDADGNPEKHPSLDGEWTHYINDGGPETDRARSNNCLDVTLAGLATWYGHPTVAAPRTPDTSIPGGDQMGEINGPDRAESWTEAQYKFGGEGPDTYKAIEAELNRLGPGASAAIINEWKSIPGSHSWAAFNDGGRVRWADFQVDSVTAEPMYRNNIGNVFYLCLDKEGNPASGH